MSASTADSPIGYLLVMQPRDAVFVGGLLVTTHRGRPLEFQCTAPVIPNATQKLLYGQTLEPHVCGDVIGAALLKKAATRPGLLLLGDGSAIDVREHAKCPVAVLLDDGRVEPRLGIASERPVPESTPAANNATDGTIFTLGPLTLQVHRDYLEDVGQIRSLDLDLESDLSEPLERVREALGQTLRGEAA